VAGAPLVVTAGAHARGFRHEEPILDGDLVGMAEGFTKESRGVLDVAALPTTLRRAFKTACTPPTGPVFLALPMDVMDAETDAAVEPLEETLPNAGRGDPGAVDLVANAESHGASGRLVEDRESLAPAVQGALAESGPSLVDVLVRE
jgi:benzoylformate decarboxylase